MLTIVQVCVDYKDLDVLREESEEGRRLGFQAKVSYNIPRVKRKLYLAADLPYSKRFIRIKSKL
jgi:hypothetical protein